MIEASPPAPLQKRGEASLQLPGSEITQNTLNHEVLATEREPEGQPRRARGDDEASVARSAARGAYRHHHSTQHCAKRAAIHRFLFICVNLCANLSLANHAARRQTAGQSPKPPKGGCTNLV